MSVSEIIAKAKAPTPADLLARAAALVPAIAARRDEADRLRDLPPQTVAELHEAGLFRVLQPADWGGFEADLRTFFAIQRKIAEACPSTAWVYGVLAVHAMLIARLDERARADVWGEDDTSLLCTAFAPTGVAEPVDGGFRLSGRWSFASGSSYSQWAMVGARIEGAQAGGPPVMNLFLIPRADYEIHDVWNTFGLRGTGSNDLSAKDIFVPAHRYICMDYEVQNLTRAARGGSALYRMPWLLTFASTVSNFALGAARGAAREFVDLARARVSAMTGMATKDNPAAAQALARLVLAIEDGEAMYDRNIARLTDYLAKDEVIPRPEAVIQWAQITGQLRKLTALMDELTVLQGSRAISVDSRITRTWLDLAAARAHVGNDPTGALSVLGAELVAG